MPHCDDNTSMRELLIYILISFCVLCACYWSNFYVYISVLASSQFFDAVYAFHIFHIYHIYIRRDINKHKLKIVLPISDTICSCIIQIQYDILQIPNRNFVDYCWDLMKWHHAKAKIIITTKINIFYSRGSPKRRGLNEE